MSAPVLLTCSAAALAFGVAALGAAAALDTKQRVQGAADAGALAAADAATGWIDGDPCGVAGEVVVRNHARMDRCEVEPEEGAASIETSAWTPLGPVRGSARAAPPPP